MYRTIACELDASVSEHPTYNTHTLCERGEKDLGPKVEDESLQNEC